jgi:hypothetical protein
MLIHQRIAQALNPAGYRQAPTPTLLGFSGARDINTPPEAFNIPNWPQYMTPLSPAGGLALYCVLSVKLNWSVVEPLTQTNTVEVRVFSLFAVRGSQSHAP